MLPEAIERFIFLHEQGHGEAVLVPGTPAWDRLAAEFAHGPGARIWQAVRESRAYPDAIDEGIALWREVFEEWLAERGVKLASVSPDELIRALGLGED